MRLVVFSEADFEPMTIVEVPGYLIQGRRPGDVVRLLPRMKPQYWEAGPMTDAVGLMPVTIRLEIMRTYLGAGMQSTWIGFAADDGLTLKSSLLPGQLADYQWECVS